MKKVRRPGPQLPPGATSRPPPRQCSEYLLLVAFDALRAGYDRDQLREAFETGQSKRGKAAVETHIGDAFRRGAAANNARRIDLGLQRRFERQIVESPGGISPPGAPRTLHDPLESHGSRCSAVAMT